MPTSVSLCCSLTVDVGCLVYVLSSQAQLVHHVLMISRAKCCSLGHPKMNWKDISS